MCTFEGRCYAKGLEVEYDIDRNRKRYGREVTDAVVRKPETHSFHACVAVNGDVGLLCDPFLGFQEMDSCRIFDVIGGPVEVVHQEKPHLLIHIYKLEYARIC